MQTSMIVYIFQGRHGGLPLRRPLSLYPKSVGVNPRGDPSSIAKSWSHLRHYYFVSSLNSNSNTPGSSTPRVMVVEGRSTAL